LSGPRRGDVPLDVGKLKKAKKRMIGARRIAGDGNG
jgi:hypothetical protein